MPFDKKLKERTLTFFIQSELTVQLAQEICTELQKTLDDSPQIDTIVFDLKGGMNYSAFRSLSPVGLKLRKDKKQMYALTSKSDIHKLIRSEGMDKIIKPIHSLDEIYGTQITPTKSFSKLDVSFINPFVEGTIHVLNVQAQLQVQPEKPLLKDESRDMKTDIAGLIGITSNGFNGGVAICFSEKVFLAIMSKMLGETYTEITKDLEDGAGEILNMIFGHAKKILNEKGHAFEKALPTIVRAPNLSLNHSSGNALILPFQTEFGPFFMEISTEKF